MKSELAGMIGQTILPAPDLDVMQDLAWSRLANIDNSAALQQIIVEFQTLGTERLLR